MSLERSLDCEGNTLEDDFTLGELYEVSGIHIEPVALYIGNGRFKGIYTESRQASYKNIYSQILSLRIGEEHSKQHRPFKTLIVHGRNSNKLLPEEIEAPPLFTRKIVSSVYEYYQNMSEDQIEERYINPELIEFKIGLFSKINSLVEKDEVVIDPMGSIDIMS